MGYVWVDDEDDNEQEAPRETNAVKNLREQYEAEKKARADLESQLKSLSKVNRERVIKDTLGQFGVPAKIAALIPDSVEASEDAVSKWLGEFGDVFGLKVEQASAPVVDEQTANAFQRAHAVERSGQQAPQGDDALAAQMLNAGSEAEFLAILAQAQR